MHQMRISTNKIFSDAQAEQVENLKKKNVKTVQEPGKKTTIIVP
jgi:hypothetical protein